MPAMRTSDRDKMISTTRLKMAKVREGNRPRMPHNGRLARLQPGIRSLYVRKTAGHQPWLGGFLAKVTGNRPAPSPITPGGPTITVITPTGDRPLAFALCRHWMANQTRKPDQWLVVDDGKTPLTPTTGMQYIRREPRPDDPQHTLSLNLATAFPLIKGDKILFMEDDDYYAPGYIDEMARHLESHEVVGIIQAKYYYLPTGGYRTHSNFSHCSLSETGFRNSFLPELQGILREREKTDIDLRIWRKVGRRGFRFNDSNKPLYLGIKGLPGRTGIGIGHNPAMYQNIKDSADRAMLKKWAPGDSQIYLDILSGKLTSENHRSYFPDDITGITVSHNTKDLLERAFNSVRKFHPTMPIIIIDGSDAQDPCAAYARSLAGDFTSVQSLGYNIGHGRGMAMGIGLAKTDLALIFDTDIEMLKSPIEAMRAMMEDDTFGVGEVDEKADFNRFVYGPHGHVDGWVRYLQPYFQLINLKNYGKFYPYVHHGAPCYLTMLDIHKKGLAGKIIKAFPGLGDFNGKEIAGEYIRHDHAGTRRARVSKHLPDIEGTWVLNKGLV